MNREPKQPKYRHHKGSGQAAVVLGGVWHYLGPHGSPESLALYRRKLAEWYACGGRAVPGPLPGLSVDAVLDAYLGHARALVGWSQLARIKSALAACRRLYGPSPAADFRGRALKAVRGSLVQTGKCRRHVNHLVGCLKKCWRWALSEELVPAESAHSVLAVAGLRRGESEAPDREPVLPVATDVVEATLPYLPPVVADMVRVQLRSGMRPGEVCRLRADEIDTSREGLWVWRPAKHKNAWRGHRRQAFLGPGAIAVLTPYLKEAGGGYLFSPRRAEAARLAAMRAARKSRVQPSQQSRKKADPKKSPGERYDRGSYCRAVAKGCKRAGVEHWHPLRLRHTAATLLVARYGWEVARVYLGHRDVNTTRVYAEDSIEKASQAAREVG